MNVHSRMCTNTCALNVGVCVPAFIMKTVWFVHRSRVTRSSLLCFKTSYINIQYSPYLQFTYILDEYLLKLAFLKHCC